MVAATASALPAQHPAPHIVASAVSVTHYPATSAVLSDLGPLPLRHPVVRASRSRPPVVRPTPVATRRHVVAPVKRVARVVPKTTHKTLVTHQRVTSSGFTITQLRIRSCESGPNGYATHGRALDYDYRNENPSSTASGAWQITNPTWGGYGGYHHAADAPPSVQDAKAHILFAASGTRPWNASRSCWGA